MKRFILIFLALGIICGILLAWRIDATTNILNVYYINITLLDKFKETKTESEQKDGAYNFVYFMSADQIVASRNTWLGKICSDRIERRNNKRLIFRENAEDYLKKYSETYSIKIDPAAKPKIRMKIK